MTDLRDTTRKIKAVQTDENEIQAALTAYLKAYDKYTEQKTLVNRKAMNDAYNHLQEIKKLYDEGRKLRNHSALPKVQS